MDRTHLLLSTAVGLAFVIAGPTAIAKGKKQPNGAKGHASVDFAKAPFKRHTGQQRVKQGLKQKFLIETWGVTTQNLQGGYFAEDTPQSITCKKACTVVTNSTAEILTYSSYNQVGICPMVDGYFTNGACYFSGPAQKNEYGNITNQTNLAVGPGAHVLQTYLYTLAPAYLGHYQNDYSVYN